MTLKTQSCCLLETIAMEFVWGLGKKSIVYIYMKNSIDQTCINSNTKFGRSWVTNVESTKEKRNVNVNLAIDTVCLLHIDICLFFSRFHIRDSVFYKKNTAQQAWKPQGEKCK